MTVYNDKMVSSVTKLTPSEARLPKNTFDVRLNLELNRRHTRKYPIIDIWGQSKNIQEER